MTTVLVNMAAEIALVPRLLKATTAAAKEKGGGDHGH